MKKILVIDAHPDDKSYCSALASSYIKGAMDADYEVRKLVLRELKFDLNLHVGYRDIQLLEPDLVNSQELIRWCEHLVLVYPIWWATMPALLKGFFDRCLLPGFAFRYHEKGPLWDKLLTGKSAHMIVTSDAPYIYYLLLYQNAPYRVVKSNVLKFCGFTPVKLTALGGVKNWSEEKLTKTLTKISRLGSAGS